MRRRTMVVGIDLAGSLKRNTGICWLTGKRILACATVHSDEEILDFIVRANPDLVVIDAPLHLPPGRKSLEDRNGEHFRPCDRELLRRGIRFFPITLGPMRSLTRRGIHLKHILSHRGFKVMEMYPGAAQDIWHIPRKQEGLNRLRHGLERLGLHKLNPSMNGDELDAISGAYVGILFLKGNAEIIGNTKHGAILLPKAKRT